MRKAFSRQRAGFTSVPFLFAVPFVSTYDRGNCPTFHSYCSDGPSTFVQSADRRAQSLSRVCTFGIRHRRQCLPDTQTHQYCGTVPCLCCPPRKFLSSVYVIILGRRADNRHSTLNTQQTRSFGGHLSFVASATPLNFVAELSNMTADRTSIHLPANLSVLNRS